MKEHACRTVNRATAVLRLRQRNTRKQYVPTQLSTRASCEAILQQLSAELLRLNQLEPYQEFGDDFHSPVKPTSYIELRIVPAQDKYRARIPPYTAWMFFWQIVLIGTTIGSAVLAYLERPTFVACLSAISTTATSWMAFRALRERVEACTHKLRTLSKLLSWWDSLGGVEQSSIANINKLVNMGELLCSAALPTGTLARTGDGGDEDKGEGRRKAKES